MNSHKWVNQGHFNNWIPEKKFMLYKCKNCEIFFRHFYFVTEDMLDAMAKAKVPQKCEDSE